MKRRFNIEISSELYVKLSILPHGTRRLIATKLLEQVATLIEEVGSDATISAIVGGELGVGFNKFDGDK